MKRETIQIDTGSKKVKCILLRLKKQDRPLPGIVWIHGGGYALGMAGMVHMSCGKMLAKRYGAVVISPEYTLAKRAPYPAALEDCCAVLQYVWDHARTLGIDRERIVVGGESAGGGLAAAVCLHARDHGEVSIAMQIPLYPMLDCEDTDSSRDNHGRVWNTKRNHWGWSRYLGDLYGTEKVPAYASRRGRRIIETCRPVTPLSPTASRFIGRRWITSGICRRQRERRRWTCIPGTYTPLICCVRGAGPAAPQKRSSAGFMKRGS
jgi:acetyl esterase/lipase